MLVKTSTVLWYLLLTAGSLQLVFADLRRRQNNEDALVSSIMLRIRVLGQTGEPAQPTVSASPSSSITASRKAHAPTASATEAPFKALNDNQNLGVEVIPTTDPEVASIMSRIAVIGNNANGAPRNAHEGGNTSSSKQTTSTTSPIVDEDALINSILNLIAVPDDNNDDQVKPTESNDQAKPTENDSLQVDPVPTTDPDVNSIMSRISVTGSGAKSKESSPADWFELSTSSDSNTNDKDEQGKAVIAKNLPADNAAITEYVSPIPTTDPDVASFMKQITVIGQKTRSADGADSDNGKNDSGDDKGGNQSSNRMIDDGVGGKFDSLTSATRMSDIMKMINVGADQEVASPLPTLAPLPSSTPTSSFSSPSPSPSPSPSTSSSPSQAALSADGKFWIPAPIDAPDPK